MDPLNIDQTQAIPPKFNPEIPEAEISSIANVESVEALPPTEIQKNEPLYQTPNQQGQNTDDSTLLPNQTQPVQAAQPKIVDKSSLPTHLRRITSPQDKLTAEADKEEAQFIEEVETAHDHK